MTRPQRIYAAEGGGEITGIIPRNNFIEYRWTPPGGKDTLLLNIAGAEQTGRLFVPI
ncbi:hypothetical protein [Acerihabitans sp.]|uniref:hypothetical protein n=1 Tax=Acerihabitans sp. TaxID=2811394 RepID=UPI002ED7D888